ncbi:MAG: hypothetical protein IKS10_04260 [Lachnospiraceae bacterium]|nr:hypothetical protein [Lachnospiraceae bacterium]
MKSIDVFACYYAAQATVNGRDRHAASVKLTATSDAGVITYEYSVSFFPHDDPEDFAISYDACESEVLFQGKGRRSKKRDAQYLKTETLREHVDALAEKLDGTVFWEQPLIEPRLG